MRLAYVSDQLLPQQATDTEQIMSMVSAFGAEGADVELVVPASWLRQGPTTAELRAHYQVSTTYSVAPMRSIYPSIRGLEKVAHGVVAARSRRLAAADVIYSRNLAIVVAALRLTDRPVVYETYRPWPLQRPLLAPFFRVLGRRPRFLGAVLHSELAARSYARAGVPQEKILVAHNGYSPERMKPVLTKADARHQCGFPVEGRVVTYAGHISEAKGHGLVLDMAARLPEVTFVLVGASQESRAIAERAAAMENVIVLPWQPFDSTVPYLYAADVLLVPPTRGPLERVGNTVLPLKTFLYLAAGRPIFGPDTEDLREVIGDGENGVLVPPDDLECAVERLQELLGDAALLERLGQNGLADSRALTWHARARRIIDFMETRLPAGEKESRT